MTSEEYEEWYANHCISFPGIKAWFTRIGLQSKEDQQAIHHEWHDSLVRTDLLDAKLASRRLKESEKRPQAYSDHPTWIAKYCRDKAQDRLSVQTFARFGQQTHKCETCRDSGFAAVFVFGNILKQSIELYGAEKAMMCTTSLHCDCELGRSRGRPNLDRSRMILWGSSSKVLLEMNPEVAERRRAQVEDMVEEMAKAETGCPF